MITAVDTNALLALLYDDDNSDASEEALRDAYRDGKLVVAPVVYAELAADGQFETTAELDRFLSDFSIQVADPTTEALFEAGEQFQRYTGRGPNGLQCPSCGERRTVDCEACGAALSPRQHIAAGFVIGGHAARDADALISFDQAFYATYFSGVKVGPK